MIVSVARPEELGVALALALGRAIDKDLVAAGEIDARGVFVAREGDVIRGAISCQPAGGTAALLSGPHGDAPDELIAAGLTWLRSRGIKIVQAMGGPDATHVNASLSRNGFVAAGPMHFMRRTVAERREYRSSQPTLRPYDEAVFARLLQQTYIGSLDFPELMGVQSIDDILAGYRANPAAKPDHWFIAEVDGASAGVLMLTEVEPVEHWDLTYLGIVPERRRQGLGRALVSAAIDIVRERGGERLEVAVDARNHPARQLYRECGFQLVEHRLVSLMFLSPDAQNSSTP